MEEKALSSTDQKEFKNLLIIGSIIGLLGAIALIVGMILQFDVFISGEVNVFGFVVVAFAFGIFIICLLTLLGTLNVGFEVNDERPGLLALVLFIFAPTVVLADFTTPLYYLLELGNSELDFGTIGFGFYLVYIGAGLFLLSFIFHVWTFLWKNRLSNSGINLSGDSEIAFVKILRVINCVLVILAGVGIILGMILPAYSSILNPDITGLLTYEDGSHLDLEALFFMALLASIVVTAVIVLLSNFGVVKSTRSEIPLLILLGITFIVPGYVPKGNTVDVWTSPFFELLVLMRGVVSDSNLSFTIWGWILLIGIIVLLLSVFIAAISFFYSKSASAATPRASRPKTVKVKKQKKGKFPTGPPSASTGPPSADVGGLASQLASSSGPPSAATGPPSAATGPPSAVGKEPTVSSSPPTPPSFMPTTGGAASGPPAASDKPTCPFCGKALRYIDEYQRWYCDACQQYV